MRGGPSAGGGGDGDDDGDPKGEVVLVVMIIADKDSAPASTCLQRLRPTATTTSSRLGVCQSTDCLSVSEHCSPVPTHLTGTVIGVTSVVHLSQSVR